MTKISALRIFDAAEYIDTPEAQTAFLSEAFDSGDPDLIRHALNVLARARGMAAIAREAGIPRESLYRALGEKGNPEFATIMRVIAALDIKLTPQVVS